MTSILTRIRANGGDVVRQEWRFALRRGRLTQEAVAWVRARWADVCREAWPLFDLWEERAAIMEFDGGLSRADAERAAYAEVAAC
ncbi:MULTISPECIES: hypothetical protein [Brevundimonas]|uniref:hypothetical protein n=1 Tax=Brevundimonas sp. UBA7507 TaxID=1946137 RepID=UPI00257D5C35|nr:MULTISPECIES: hypothetical protein [Brevundimonas]